MAIKVETKDTTALSDAELVEMADMCTDRPAGFDVGYLSKQREEWVLVSRCWDGSKLRSWSYTTLERIGGTPCLLVGAAAVEQTARAETMLRHLMGDNYRRAVLAFPDEDVLVGVRIADARALGAFAGLEDIVPRPGHRSSGEERAWGRRLAKRFGAEARLDDRTFVITGNGEPCGVLDFTMSKKEPPRDVAAQLAGLDAARRDCLVTFGWAMAESLAAGKLGR